ncbi:hypothetical protein E2562_013675 [Oryza meyeriana var. granulata]|uniref:F-box/LRR-repeat protein 15/At3g58940/PEG3-like LRR domain-containing protein n=1 Tax=Oryza meyeriana var. granulata TaxID=110450 RepID=A0A6G1BJV0_9ORYZ|nr:hypothetical protein E2562_013675 [Oryza meyeriana var. granulata]
MRETTTSAAAAVDMISDLSDDVLLLILGFLLSARDVVRTSVLSRRWRHLWTLAPTLRFAVGKPACWTITEDEVAAACRLIPAVDSVLARRDDAGGPDVKDLEISFVYRPGGDVPNDYDLFQYGYDAKDITRERVAAWVRFAESRVTETFTLEVPMGKSRWRDKWRAPLVADLPRSERFRAMQLMLGGAILRIRPDAGAFRALTDVLLSQVTLRDGDDLRLCHLLSSTCCPQLRRLELRNIYGLTNLRLDAAGTLEELLLDNLCLMRRMQVDAPGLRELTVLNICVHVATAASISAPRLRLLTCANMCGRFDRMVLDGTGIAKLRVLSHGDPGRNDNRAAAWFLQHCAAADRLEVEVMMKLLQDIEDVMKDIPKLPNITDLRIKASIRTGTMDTHCIGASITKLIAKCNRIEYLSIDIDEKILTANVTNQKAGTRRKSH